MNSPVTIDPQLILGKFREAGYAVRFEPEDRVHRVRMRLSSSPTLQATLLVGIVVIRTCPADLEPRVMYAEFAGRVFPWWGVDRNSIEYGQSLANLVELIGAEAL